MNIFKLMEPRKLIQFGNSSYVITLPQQWVKNNDLDKGDVINLAENDDRIILTIADKKKEEKTATISLDDVPLKLFNKELISYYLKNYKYIKITASDCIDKLEQIRVLKDKLSSVEIMEINKEYIILKDLTSPSELNIHKLMNEIIGMEKVLFEKLKSDENGKDKYYIITNLDKNINKLTFLALKAINYNLDMWINSEDVKNTIDLKRIIASLERVGDIIKRVSRYLKDNEDVSKKFKKVLDEMEDYFSFVTSLINPEINLENNLRVYLDKKQSILKSLDFMREELKEDLNLYLVISQLLKDILGQLDNVLLSVIDLKCK